MGETILALIAAIPKIISFFSIVFNYVESQKDRSIGRKEAIEEALEIGGAELSRAIQIKAEADRIHANDPTDTAFDSEFKRKD